MLEATRLAPFLTGPAWILALEQTAGRGRRGRAWQGGAGNFSATYLTRPRSGPAEAALYSFITALALYEALATLIGPSANLSIKWPNDVLLNGGKIAGILLESVGQGGQLTHLAIGVGVNLRQSPPANALEPRALAPVNLASETGINITPQEFLPALAHHFAAFSAQYQTLGFAPIRRAWLDRAARLGQEITARTSQSEQTGIFETIDETGALILKTAESRIPIAAADIFF